MGGITALKSYSDIMDHKLLKLVKLAYLEETHRWHEKLLQQNYNPSKNTDIIFLELST